MPKTEILGIKYDNVTLGEAAADVISLAQGRKAHFVVTPNPEISESCISNLALREAVSQADYVVPDGIGVIMAAKICASPLKERVGGYDLACALLPLIEKDKLSLYLLGAKPTVAEMAKENITAKYSQINICGVHDGYFNDDDEVIDQINALSPDILFVALGSPRQEIWMAENRSRINTGVMLGLGGGLDVFAGIVKRAPQFFIRFNLEWFYRLLCQPSRFVRMLKLPKYIMRAIKSRVFIRAGRVDL
jgi:N-acetylglucosaminyldiphosphoundecaprenol N-acetyl-beta-D-mannosaminyltransferase